MNRLAFGSKKVLLGVALGAALLAGPAWPRGQAGRELFESKCARCHGLKGDGQGNTGHYLRIQPRNFTDARWQSDRSDEQIAEVITQGGAGVRSVKSISRKMPKFKEKLNAEQIKSLVPLIRGFKTASTAA